MNLEFLHTDRWYCEAVIHWTKNEMDDLICFLCKRCGIRFTCKRHVLYGGVHDKARSRRLRVRCPSYPCQAFEYVEKRKSEWR